MLCDLCVLCGEKRATFINILIYFYAAQARSRSNRHESNQNKSQFRLDHWLDWIQCAPRRSSCRARSRIQLAVNMPGGATDAMVHPDASSHMDCHGRNQSCERREPYDSVPVWIRHNMRAEVSVKITCLCFSKPRMNADLILYGGANKCHNKPMLCDICVLV
jgi:hypothetical protein